MYFTTAAAILYAIFIWFIIPESLTPAKMAPARQRYAERVAENNTGIFETTFQFLSPLLVIGPKRVQVSTSSLKSKRDWTLTILSIICGLISIIDAAALYELQYGMFS